MEASPACDDRSNILNAKTNLELMDVSNRQQITGRCMELVEISKAVYHVASTSRSLGERMDVMSENASQMFAKLQKELESLKNSINQNKTNSINEKMSDNVVRCITTFLILLGFPSNSGVHCAIPCDTNDEKSTKVKSIAISIPLLTALLNKSGTGRRYYIRDIKNFAVSIDDRSLLNTSSLTRTEVSRLTSMFPIRNYAPSAHKKNLIIIRWGKFLEIARRLGGENPSKSSSIATKIMSSRSKGIPIPRCANTQHSVEEGSPEWGKYWDFLKCDSAYSMKHHMTELFAELSTLSNGILGRNNEPSHLNTGDDMPKIYDTWTTVESNNKKRVFEDCGSKKNKKKKQLKGRMSLVEAEEMSKANGKMEADEEPIDV